MPSHSALLRRVLYGFSLVLALVLLPALPAAAHAELSTSDPADQAVVDVAPKQIVLRYSESVAVQPDGVRVLDRDAERVDTGTARADGPTVTAPLVSGLPDGSYVVAWRALSADGHPIRGAFTFSVGTRREVRTGLVDEAFAQSDDTRDEVLSGVLRWLGYLGILGATGLVVVGAALRRPDEPAPVGRLATGLGVLGLVAVLAQIPVLAALATGRGLGSLREPGVLSLVLADGVGWSVGLIAIGLVAMLVTSGLPFQGAARLLAVGGSFLAPVGLVVTGHTRTMSPAVLAYGADAAHVVAGSFWFGGLVALLLVVRRRRNADDAPGAGAAVARFSGWAIVVVAVVAVAGATLGWIEVGSLRALTSTSYGRLLMAKVAAVGLVVAAAAWNRFRLVDRVGSERQDPAAWSTLSRIMRFEVGAILVVLALTSVLVNVTPARDVAGGGIQTASAALADGTVEMIVDPARPGRNDVHLYLLDARGAPDGRYEDASFRFELPAQGVGPLEREPIQAGPGHFQVIGTDFDLEGEWTLTLTVKVDRFTEETVELRFRID